MKDSLAFYVLIDQCKPLNMNSPYDYMLVSTHFKDTSIMYQNSVEIKGFMSEYIDPRVENTLFIWHVASKQHHTDHALELLHQRLILES